MAGIGILLNRNSAKARAFRGQIGEKLAFVLGDPTSVLQTSTVDEIDQVAKTFRERGVEILGLSGGDGSNHYAMTKFIQVYGDQPLPKIALLCGGTHNGHALSLGMRGSPEKLLERIVRKYHTGEPLPTTRRKVLKVVDGKREHYGFTLATGFMYRFYEELHIRQDDTPLKVAGLIASWIGSFAVGGRLVRDIFRLENGRLTTSADSPGWEQQNGIGCSTMEKIGLGFTPFPRANESIALFHAGAFRIKPGTFIRLMLDFKRGRVPKHPDHFSTVTDRATLECERPISYILDGEIYHGLTKLEVTTGPQIDMVVV